MIRLIILFFVMPFALSAAPIVVKSGEHSDFTRLVIYLSADEDWSIEQSDGLAVFSVEGWQQGYDISTVFERINKDRLKSLTASDANLVMNLECACEVDVSELPQGFVSIDIRNSERRRPVPKPQTAPKPVQVSQSVVPEPAPEIDWPVVFENPQDFSSFDRVLANTQSAKSTAFEGGLSEEISRSATLTYLEPSGVELDRTRQSDPVPGTRSQGELLAILGERARFLNAGEIGAKVEKQKVDVCPPTSSLAISSWGGELPFVEELADLRGRLFSEFDALDQEALRDLIRFFVHYGLAPEARSTMAAFGDAQSDQMQELAAFVSGERKSSPSLAALAGCKGETGFWAFLTNPDVLEQSQAMVEGHVSVFQRLPFDLQSLMADQLIVSLRDAGFETAAGVVKNTIIANSTDDISQESDVALVSDLKTRNRDDLLQLIAKNDAQTPDALLVYLQQSNSQNTPISNDLLELSRSYVRQLDGTDISAELLTGVIEATAVSGDLNMAISEAFANAGHGLANEAQLFERLFDISLMTEDLPNLSELVWKLHRRERLTLLPVALRRGGAEFLEQKGHPQLALQLLGETPTDVSPGTMASVYAQLGNPEDAIELLRDSSLESLGADMSARLLNTDPQVAWSLRETLTGEAAELAAWSSQNWSDVEGETARARASNLILAAQESNIDPDAPISDAKTAQDLSRETRRVLAELLN